MAFTNTKSVRFGQFNLDMAEALPVSHSRKNKPIMKRKLSRVFSEDYDVVDRKILDPRGTRVGRWNKCFLVACLVSLFVDPLFYYLPELNDKYMCMEASKHLEVSLTGIRTIVDLFYMVQIIVQFRTAYVAPSSRVTGRGELVIDSKMIASRYLRKYFWLDLLAALPLPQVLLWITIPRFRALTMVTTKVLLHFVIIVQFFLRLYLIFPLSSKITKASGVLVEAAWTGAAYNLSLFMLASHVVGACWYLLAVERQEQCWKSVCDLQGSSCQYFFFSCLGVNAPGRADWFHSSNISSLCGPKSDFFQFGIVLDALTNRVPSSNFFNKYFYCLWWGVRGLSSVGQNLATSTCIPEIHFCIIIAVLGLVLFALLIGNMQAYLQSTTVRLEEWRVKRTDTEQWMHHRQLPHELRERVRTHDVYEWVTTRGVNEEAILSGLPPDLRRDIKRHLCIELVRQVPLFALMDEHTIDAICERLKPVLCTPSTCLVRESDPVNEMLFIVRGHLDSYTTDGGRTGFLNSCRIGPGEFCGEELLNWALDPCPSSILPSSTRTVTAIAEVEAFALASDDLKFVASQFRKLHSKKLRHTFRAHSHQWRTWAACFIQAAWFRYKRRKESAKLKAKEGLGIVLSYEPSNERTGSRTGRMDAGLAMYTATLAESTRRGRGGSEFEVLSSLTKPVEPDFSDEDR